MSEEMHINNDIFRRKLVRLVLPIAFQQFMLAIVSASDALMLGKVEQESLAAVSLAGQVTFVQNLFLGAMTIGTSMFAAQYWGKGDRRSVEKVFAYVLKVTTIVSALFGAAGLTIPDLLMKIFTNEPVLIERGAQYLRVVALSYLLSGISQIYLCVLKNSEKAVKATTISSVVVVLNVLLNALLIFGLCGLPRMEIAGAALATVLAKVVELVHEKGYSVGNADITIALQRPKIGKYVEQMRSVMAEVMGISIDCVSVKATTNEKMGFVGRCEGCQVWASAVVWRA